VEELKPWGKLLGDEVPVYHMGQVWGGRGRKKKVAVAQTLPIKESL